MQRQQFLIIINPRSGKYREEIFQKRMAAVLGRGALPGETYYIDEWEKLAERVNQAISEGITSFVAVGGDGTVAAVASYLRGTRYPITIIPTGTSNMLARALGIPINSQRALRELFSSTKTKAIDGLEINGRLYFMNASAGISSASLKGLKQEHKSLFGLFAYALAVTPNIFKATSNTFSLEVDGKSQQVKATEVFIANVGSLISPRYRLADSQLDDGKLEVCVVHKTTLPEILNVILDILIRKRGRGIHCLARGERITISCEKCLPVQADGDIIGATPVTIRVIPQAATFVVPQEVQG